MVDIDPDLEIFRVTNQVFINPLLEGQEKKKYTNYLILNLLNAYFL